MLKKREEPGGAVVVWRLQAALCTAVRTNDCTVFHQETAADEAGLAFVAVEAFRVPVPVFESDEFAATKACMEIGREEKKRKQ
ncbi:unnamed protein product [Dibothriocephalus latus]|uniref:Uncharacterized protein n=1 Tax=Dibothriocephalus latus TaxID=60516 RepID=A0A3P7L4U1_DIBLA|nr:unnamed protein product [Dibothriocephalus latus]